MITVRIVTSLACSASVVSKFLNTTEYILAKTQNWKNREYMAVVAL